MSNMLPAKVEHKRVWEVDALGSAIERKKAAPAPQPLTSGQRHYFYRLGLMAVAQFLKERGFSSSSDSQSTLIYELRQQCWIDIAIKNPANIAYVTSRPGYDYKQEVIGKTLDNQEMYRVRASVTTAKDILGCSKVIQIVVTTRQSTHTPIYIPLPSNLDNPAKHVVSQVIATLGLLCDQFPILKEALSKIDPEAVPIPEKLDVNFLWQLPE